MPKVSVVVCTLNREKELEDFLSTLNKQTFRDYELIIVSDRPLRVPRAKIIIQKGKGLPNARNHALPHIRGEIVAFFDDDVLLEKDYLERVVRAFEENPGIGGVTGMITNTTDSGMKSGMPGKIMSAYGRVFRISGFFSNIPKTGKVLSNGFTCSNFNAKEHMDVEWLSGCNMCYSKKAVEGVGGFDEGLIGNAYYEDTDFSYRAFREGYRLVYEPGARLKHMVTPTSRESLARLKYNQIVNQKRFFHRNVHGGSLLRLLMNRTAHLSLSLPVLFYSVFTMNSELLKNYIYAEMGWKA
jgi:GT2 family glycosyltransferase